MKTNCFPLIITAALLIMHASAAGAQTIGVKTNALYWATGTVNVGAEIAIAPKTTIELMATCNIPGLLYFGDKALNRKIWHWTVQPEVRFWNREPFNGGFVGIHAGGGAFDGGGIKLPFGIVPNFAGHRYEGWLMGAGVSYGHQWLLTPRLNLEATVGFGYFYMEYNRFSTPASKKIDVHNRVRHYVGPSRVGLSLYYMLGSKK
jgi:hypothetical protein